MDEFARRCVYDAATDLRAKAGKRRRWADKQNGQQADLGRRTADSMYAAAEFIADAIKSIEET